MDIERLIKDLVKQITKTVLNKREETSVRVKVDNMDSTDVFKIMFNKLFHEGNFNKAEDLIFYELKSNNSPEIYEIALQFYNSLLDKSDEDLEKSNFTRVEVYDGLKDLERFKVTS
ncbi:hypothetical protein C3495_13805 (plasmid) [Clostridiaceae bacterium 14S0207]|nr:hypothetical protein C3495_13805 [Clostridiaceae bacterium 14S0207]